jgi:hypothetical protein
LKAKWTVEIEGSGNTIQEAFEQAVWNFFFNEPEEVPTPHWVGYEPTIPEFIKGVSKVIYSKRKTAKQPEEIVLMEECDGD